MGFHRRTFLLLIAAVLLAGCTKSEPVPVVTPTEARTVPSRAQPKLPTIKLWLGAQELVAELAFTSEQMRAGMMFRTEMAENEAMLFVFEQPHRAAFWMKNTPLELSAAYIGSDGSILEIHDLKPHDESSVAAGTDRVRYVLETRRGWFGRNGIGVGSVIRTERGSLQETFFGR